MTTGTTRAISAISKQSPGRVTTALPHGLSTGDAVYITSVAGGGFTALNSSWYNVTVISSTVFSLNGINTSGYTGTYTAGSGFIQECQTTECEEVVTSASHGLVNNDVAYITSVGGATGLNGNLYLVSDSTTNTYALEDTDGPSYGTYTSGGRSYCTKYGCYYQYFQNANNGWNFWTISNCVTERVGANQYTDAAPSTTYVSAYYPSPKTNQTNVGACPVNEIIPLSDDKTALHTLASNLEEKGSTAGQIGLAWAWYLLSPNFAYMLPNGSKPDNPATNTNLIKVVVLMTDGAFNTANCNGIHSSDTTIIPGDDRIKNCNAPNGDSFTQAENICAAIKKGSDGVLGNQDDIILYTVGFDVGTDQDAIDFLSGCATDTDHAFLASDGADLTDAFTEIGNNISALRVVD